MTARVCPVHGEYAPTGICRWCEKPSVADHEWAMHTWPPWYPTEESPTEELARINAGVVGEPPGTQALRDVKSLDLMPSPLVPWWEWKLEPVPSLVGYETTFTLLEQTTEAYVWRLEWTEPVIDAETHAAEESRLLAQHAALRWERVARRWNYKHRNPKGLNEQERAYVWRCWLAQQQRIFDDGEWLRRHIAAGIPKEWP